MLSGFDIVPELVTRLLGIPCVWDGSAEPFLAPEHSALARINITANVAKGVDETRRDPITGRTELNVLQTGYRVVTLSVGIESYSPEESAQELLETLRMRLRRQSSKDLLSANGLALVSMPSFAILNMGAKDDRVVDYGRLDVKLAAALNDQDDPQVTIGIVLTEAEVTP